MRKNKNNLHSSNADYFDDLEFKINQISEMPIEDIKSELAQMGVLDIPIPKLSDISKRRKPKPRYNFMRYLQSLLSEYEYNLNLFDRFLVLFLKPVASALSIILMFGILSFDLFTSRPITTSHLERDLSDVEKHSEKSFKIKNVASTSKPMIVARALDLNEDKKTENSSTLKASISSKSKEKYANGYSAKRKKIKNKNQSRNRKINRLDRIIDKRKNYKNVDKFQPSIHATNISKKEQAEKINRLLLKEALAESIKRFSKKLETGVAIAVFNMKTDKPSYQLKDYIEYKNE